MLSASLSSSVIAESSLPEVAKLAASLCSEAGAPWGVINAVKGVLVRVLRYLVRHRQM